MINDLFESNLAFTFHSQRLPLPPDQRLSWRLPVLILAIFELRGSKASFKQLAIVSYALNTIEGQREVEHGMEHGCTESRVFVRYEPGLPFILAYAVARGLIKVTAAKKYSLTEAGRSFARKIAKHEAFCNQVAFLKTYGKRLNETIADRLLNPQIHLDDIL